MSRGLGKVQRQVLALLTTPCAECGCVTSRCDLRSLACNLDAPSFCYECSPLDKPTRSAYVSVSRAVRGLQERGCVTVTYCNDSVYTWEDRERLEREYGEDATLIRPKHGHGRRHAQITLTVDCLAKTEANQRLTEVCA